MSMHVKKSNDKSNIRQCSQVEFLAEDVPAVSLRISAIESQTVLKEGKKNNVNILEEKVIQLPQDMSIILNDSDNANMNSESEMKSLSEKEPVVGLTFAANLSQNDADEEKNKEVMY